MMGPKFRDSRVSFSVYLYFNFFGYGKWGSGLGTVGHECHEQRWKEKAAVSEAWAMFRWDPYMSMSLSNQQHPKVCIPLPGCLPPAFFTAQLCAKLKDEKKRKKKALAPLFRSLSILHSLHYCFFFFVCQKHQFITNPSVISCCC